MGSKTTPAQERRYRAFEQGRNEAEILIAREIQRVTGCSRDEAMREAARLVRENPAKYGVPTY
jgi:hypothetical protein